MLSCDHHVRAADVAEALDLDEFHAELMSEDTARIFEKLSASGARIAFVGDGINDVPALSVANRGIAMQKGSDIALHEGNIARKFAMVGKANTWTPSHHCHT